MEPIFILPIILFFLLLIGIFLLHLNAESILGGIGRFIAHIVYSVIRLLTYLLAFVMGLSFFRRNSTGVSRVAIFLACMIGIYLLIVFSRGFIPALSDPYYNRLFGGALSLVLLTFIMIILMFVPMAAAKVDGRDIHDEESISGTLSAFFVIAPFISLLALYSQQTLVPEMAASNCETIERSDTPGVLARTTEGARGLFDRLTNKDAPPEDPCETDVR